MKRLVIRFNAPVVLGFALLSLAVLLLDSVIGGDFTQRFFCVYRSSLSDPLTYVRLFGHVLGHTGYTHYMGNMLLFLLVGPAVESRYGSRATLLFILITAVVTGVVQFVFFPDSALLGASGIVFMMIVLSSFTDMKKDGIPITMILVVVLYLGREIIDGLFVKDSVSQIAHIVGGVCGLVFGFAGRKESRRAKK
ncbi:MAG: rhomboid family intramembrane serine protease [Oscillospiraceae bacterium]|nr:rhomboid family intramembrane serine protease [Oscillospiraceae bacterium]